MWLLATLNSHETMKGMRVKFQDVECFRDYQYEYEDEIGDPAKSPEFTVWNPLTLTEIKQKEEKEKREKEKKPVVVDSYTDEFAAELGLRSLKNQSKTSSVELLDLSFLDYDAIDVQDGEENMVLKVIKTKSKSEVTTPSDKAKNETVDGRNLTAVDLLNQSEYNTIQLLDSSTPSTLDNSTELKTENTTVYSTDVLVMNETMTTNATNTTASPMVGMTNLTENTNLTATPQGNASLVLEIETNATLTGNNQTSDGLLINSSHNVQTSSNSSLGNLTHALEGASSLQNLTVKTLSSNSSLEVILEDKVDITALLERSNSTSSSAESFSNETMSLGNLTLSRNDSSDQQSSSESSEEVVIYLRENDTSVIKTKSIKTQEHNWTYDATHQVVSMDIPEDILKYLGKESLKTTPAPKKTRKISLRQKPMKGQGMKTKRRKEYKPQSRSGLPFSPRGFNPGMTPRGARPNLPYIVSDEEELINTPVVIGVPRPDFSDYELYIPGDEPEHLALEDSEVKDNEYEYVVYKDPYSDHSDIKDLNLDETAKYYLKFAGPNVKTYFIAAEEVEWDYAGYGHK